MPKRLLPVLLLLALSGCSRERILADAPVSLGDSSAPISALSGTGTDLLVGRDNQYLAIWDLASGAEKQKLVPGSSTGIPYLAVALASGGRYSTVLKIGRVRAVQMDPDRVLREAEFKTTAAVAAAISRDQTLAVVADTGALVYRTSLQGPRDAPQDFLIKSYNGGFNSLDLSADGTMIIGAQGTSVSLFDAKTGAELKVESGSSVSYSGKQPFVDVVAFSPDATFAIAGLSTGDLQWIDVSGKKQGPRVSGRHASPVTAVAFSADHSLGASGDVSGNIALWDPEKRTALGTLKAPSEIRALFVADDGQRIVAGGKDGSLLEWTLTRKH